MLISEMNAVDLYSIIMSAFLSIGLLLFVIRAYRDTWGSLSNPQRVLFGFGSFVLYGLPAAYGITLMAP